MSAPSPAKNVYNDQPDRDNSAWADLAMLGGGGTSSRSGENAKSQPPSGKKGGGRGGKGIFGKKNKGGKNGNGGGKQARTAKGDSARPSSGTVNHPQNAHAHHQLEQGTSTSRTSNKGNKKGQIGAKKVAEKNKSKPPSSPTGEDPFPDGRAPSRNAKRKNGEQGVPAASASTGVLKQNHKSYSTYIKAPAASAEDPLPGEEEDHVASHYDRAAARYGKQRKNMREPETGHFRMNNWTKTCLCLFAMEFALLEEEEDVVDDEEDAQDIIQRLAGTENKNLSPPDSKRRKKESFLADGQQGHKHHYDDCYNQQPVPDHTTQQRTARTRTIRILDLACGRGGDLFKWHNTAKYFLGALGWNAKCIQFEYVGVDLSAHSIALGRQKWAEQAKPLENFSVEFHQFDFTKQSAADLLAQCTSRSNYGSSSSTTICGQTQPNSTRSSASIHNRTSASTSRSDSRLFDIISCQFALHYAFESEATIANFGRLVQECSKKTSVFVGTTIDERWLVEEARKKFGEYSLAELEAQCKGTTTSGSFPSEEKVAPPAHAHEQSNVQEISTAHRDEEVEDGHVVRVLDEAAQEAPMLGIDGSEEDPLDFLADHVNIGETYPTSTRPNFPGASSASPPNPQNPTTTSSTGAPLVLFENKIARLEVPAEPKLLRKWWEYTTSADAEHKVPAGLGYDFFLEGAIDNCLEYLVDFRLLEKHLLSSSTRGKMIIETADTENLYGSESLSEMSYRTSGGSKRTAAYPGAQLHPFRNTMQPCRSSSLFFAPEPPFFTRVNLWDLKDQILSGGRGTRTRGRGPTAAAPFCKFDSRGDIRFPCLQYLKHACDMKTWWQSRRRERTTATFLTSSQDKVETNEAELQPPRTTRRQPLFKHRTRHAATQFFHLVDAETDEPVFDDFPKECEEVSRMYCAVIRVQTG
ncbi:unnamed protein product [Amoebophrya sp. A120]|nr:unnamed protein product [Amoebophrya sp. A120]|eukprot:GSA120T00021486001.1